MHPPTNLGQLQNTAKGRGKWNKMCATKKKYNVLVMVCGAQNMCRIVERPTYIGVNDRRDPIFIGFQTLFKFVQINKYSVQTLTRLCQKNNQTIFFFFFERKKIIKLSFIHKMCINKC